MSDKIYHSTDECDKIVEALNDSLRSGVFCFTIMPSGASLRPHIKNCLTIQKERIEGILRRIEIAERSQCEEMVKNAFVMGLFADKKVQILEEKKERKKET